jgi:hypothetical protein
MPVQQNGRDVLAFDPYLEQYATWRATTPAGWSTTSPPTADVWLFMASGTEGDIILAMAVEAIDETDDADWRTTDSFDTENVGSAETVPTTPGRFVKYTITLTNHDSSEAHDQVRFRLFVKSENAGHTAPGWVCVYEVVIHDAA